MQAECNKALVLDNETSPLSLELMAKAEEGLGNTVIAKEYYIKAKNAVVWQYTTHTPRCPSFIEDLIREIIGQNPDCELIDLPEIFYQRSGKIIPDKTLFVDYVHHSLKGMDWVSDALASAITKKIPLSIFLRFMIKIVQVAIYWQHSIMLIMVNKRMLLNIG